MRKMPIATPSSRRLLGAALTASLVAPFTGALADEQTVTDNIQKHMPGVPIDSIKESPAEGIYEMVSNGQVAYVTADGKYLIAGDLIDVEQRRNLTQAKQDEQRVARLKDIPEDRKLVYPAEGETKHSITVLTDPTCPFCDKLHKELPALQSAGVEVNYILTPRQGPGSKGFEISSRTLCADDPKQALDGAMTGKSVSADACRDDVIEENMALSNELGMSGTPYTILPDGSAVPGYRPAKAMLEAIRSSDG
ncbi:MAG: DsbC family protein [Guyparkeria sp.]